MDVRDMGTGGEQLQIFSGPRPRNLQQKFREIQRLGFA
jgi:hypothetical protein